MLATTTYTIAYVDGGTPQDVLRREPGMKHLKPVEYGEALETVEELLAAGVASLLVTTHVTTDPA